MTLDISQLTKIQQLHTAGNAQRIIAHETNHALGTINKYVRMLKVLSSNHPLIYELHCRYLLADNAHITTEELQMYFKQELNEKLTKAKVAAILVHNAII